MRRANLVLAVVLLFLVGVLIRNGYYKNSVKNSVVISLPSATPEPTITPTPSPTPSPSPLTFAQMQALYGPCVYAPTLMYHHIENIDDPTIPGHGWLTVTTRVFREQMQYLRDRGYMVISMQEIVNFFDNGTPPPAKSVLLTFDDAYSDFSSDALPVLREYSYPATLFVPTGLLENVGYLTWNQLNDAANNRVLAANHTWSHKNVGGGDRVVIEQEIVIADGQLVSRGFNNPKVFSYPYGPAGNVGIEILQNNGYKLAFTTIPGSTLCKGQRLNLPRVRIGSFSLSAFGF